jgi:membrane fusion protein (multidrug efflux system)
MGSLIASMGVRKFAEEAGANHLLAGEKILVTRCAFVLAFGAFLWTSGCGISGNKNVQADTSAPVTVMVSTLEPQDLPLYSEFAAQTYARNTVDVRARVAGYIEKWLFSPGAEVTAGQVLYVLDLSPYEAARAQAQGNVRQSEADLDFARQQVSLLQAEAALSTAQANQIKAKQDFERIKPLVEADAASKQDLDSAVAALASADANVRSAQANVDQARLSTRTQIASNEGKLEALKGALETADVNLRYGTIRAPISGRIGDTLVPVGGLVTPTSAQPLTTIVPVDPIWIRFKVTESEYLSWAKRGNQGMASRQPIMLTLADGSEYPWKGHIENTLNQVDPKTGTLELQASFPNPQHTLLPGQFGRARIQVDEIKGALAVPQRALQQIQNISTVYTVGSGDKIQVRGVTTGSRVGELWIVSKGLDRGDRVVVEGVLKVHPGTVVHALPWNPGK